MMLDHLGERKAAAQIEKAVTTILSEGKIRTVDLGGTNTTSDVADAIVAKIQ
jgi:isocitrate/isopropylmalate dehydrogenase